MSKTAAKPHLSEAEEQCKLMAWAEYCVWAGVYPELALLFAIPNGGKRNAAEAAHFNTAMRSRFATAPRKQRTLSTNI